MQFYQHSKSDFDKSIKISKLPVVYLLGAKNTNFYKIGFSRNLKHRIENIQGGCPHQIILHSVIRTPYPNKIESFLHEMFAYCHYRGEWFSPSEHDLDCLFSFFEKTNSHIREVHNALLQA